MRCGLHSGPVTAGVLRGDKSRFQLFGDTVNTASRMESTGERNRVHLSYETAHLLIEGGKSHWIQPRDTPVHVKGKGEMKTYWLKFVLPSISGASSSLYIDKRTAQFSDPDSQGYNPPPVEETFLSYQTSLDRDHLDDVTQDEPDNFISMEKQERLVGWTVDVLSRLLRQMVAQRADTERTIRKRQYSSQWRNLTVTRGVTILDEVQETISLPNEPAQSSHDSDSLIELPKSVQKQLTDYVSIIASMYRDNSFHSFEHATHVTMSSLKLLSRVVTRRTTICYDDLTYTARPAAVDNLHEFTHGITSDPLTQFAVVFSALIHDVDHAGVPNFILVQENDPLALLYKNKSVAEQNSVDLAWELLWEPSFADLRACIYTNQAELDRFRHLVVNAVMATDIFDSELSTLRKNRWEKAFHENPAHHTTNNNQGDCLENVHRKATIVIEHLIQASDVSHTMQHWHVYVKWNERLFHEMYAAYLQGRSAQDPSEHWFSGELKFLDCYVIPLAKKLQECNVFGVASDEYLNYVKANRIEWEAKGEQLVANYLSSYRRAS